MQETREQLKQGLLQRLVYSVGKDPQHALPRDWCVALTLAIRDRIVDAWMDSTRKTYESGSKRVYYLSMEFLIGRLLADTMSNLGITDICREVIAEQGVDFDAVILSEPDAALGNGGLGRLAACFLDSMSTIGIAGFGYGIRYQHGLFRQRLADGWQLEQAENWLMFGHPWEFERPESSYVVGFGGLDAWRNGDRERLRHADHRLDRAAREHAPIVVGEAGRAVRSFPFQPGRLPARGGAGSARRDHHARSVSG
jgi:glucan phosphorylase